MGCAIAAGYYVLTQELANGAVYLPELTVRAFGKAAGRVVLAIGGVFTLLAAAQTARRAGIAFPDGTAWLAGGVIVLLGTLAGEKDAKQAAKVCGVLFLVLAGLYTIIILAAAKSAQLRWMAPWGGARQTLEVVPSLLALTCLRFLPGRTQRVKRGWLGLLAICPAVLAAVTAGCLSPRLTQQLTFPFYTVSQSLSVLGVMERLEPVVSAALLMGFFALESLLLEAGREQIVWAAPNLAEKRWGAGRAWNRCVRTQLCDGWNTSRSMGFGGSCMLGNRTVINATNSGHKLIFENSKKRVDKRLLL